MCKAYSAIGVPCRSQLGVEFPGHRFWRADVQVFSKTARAHWWPLEEWSAKVVDKNKTNAAATYTAARKRWQELHPDEDLS